MAHQLSQKSDAVAVIGGVNMDIWGRPTGALVMHDSCPGTVRMTPGGVGRNIAHNLRLLGLDVAFITAMGDDLIGRALMDAAHAGKEGRAQLHLSLCHGGGRGYVRSCQRHGHLRRADAELL